MPSGTYSIKWDNHWTLKLLEAIQGNDAWNRSLFGKSIVKTNDIWKATRDICLLLFGKDEAWSTFMHGKGFVEKNDHGDVMPTGQWGSKFKDPVRTKLENLNRAVTSKSLKRKHGFSKRWKQWSDIPDSVQRNKLLTACPYYLILHELHGGKPAYVPPTPVAPLPAVPPSAPRPNKRPRQLPTPGDSSEEEDAPKVIRGRKSSPIIVDDTTDIESDQTGFVSGTEKDGGSSDIGWVEPVASRGQRSKISSISSMSHSRMKDSRCAPTPRLKSRAIPSSQVPVANNKVQQGQSGMVSDSQGPWGCHRLAVDSDSDSGEENADMSEVDGSDAEQESGGDEVDAHGDHDHDMGQSDEEAATHSERRRPSMTARVPRYIQTWLKVARFVPQDVGLLLSFSSKLEKDHYEQYRQPCRTVDMLPWTRAVRLRYYLKSFLRLREKGLVLVGPPIDILDKKALSAANIPTGRLLHDLLKELCDMAPFNLVKSYTKGDRLRLVLTLLPEGRDRKISE